MKKKVLIGVGVLVGLMVIGALNSGHWRSIQSAEGGFKVQMKGSLKTSTETENVPLLGNLVIRQWNADGPKSMFTLTYLEMPAAAPSGIQLNYEGAMQKIREGIIRRSGGTVRAERSSTLSGQTATEQEVEVAAPKMHLRFRSLLQAPKLYVLAYAYPGDEEPPGDGDRFFDSFALQ